MRDLTNRRVCTSAAALYLDVTIPGAADKMLQAPGLPVETHDGALHGDCHLHQLLLLAAVWFAASVATAAGSFLLWIVLLLAL